MLLACCTRSRYDIVLSGAPASAGLRRFNRKNSLAAGCSPWAFTPGLQETALAACRHSRAKKQKKNSVAKKISRERLTGARLFQ